MTKMKLTIIATCGALSMLATAAQAAVFRFSLGNAGEAIWQIDTRNSPAQEDSSGLTYARVTGAFRDAGASGVDIDFFSGTADPAGGLRLTDVDSGAGVWYSGPTLFTGTGQSLAFTIGTFALTDVNDGSSTLLSISDVTAAAVPEPATWLMTILGFGSIGAALRHPRRRASAPAAA